MKRSFTFAQFERLARTLGVESASAQPYELNPTALELRAWLRAADSFAVEVTRQVTVGPRGRDGATGA